MKNETREYQKFVQEFVRLVGLLTKGQEAELVFLRAGGEEGLEEDGLELRLKTGKQGVRIKRFYIEKLYASSQMGKTMAEIIADTKEVLDQCLHIQAANPLEYLDEYPLIASSLVVRPLNYNENREKLEDAIFELIGDIALAVYVNLGNYHRIYASSMVPKDMLSAWNLSQSEALNAAKANTLRLFPPRIFQWYSVNPDKEGGSYCPFMDPGDRPFIRRGPFGTFITTENQCNGAAAIFLPGVAKRLGEIFKSDFYIAFTSMHESVIHDCRTVDPENIRSSLRHMNQMMPSEEDFLSANPYYYNRARDCISMLG